MKMICQCFNAEITFIECVSVINELIERGAKFNFNPSSFIRIFIPKLIPDSVEKALFIDSDTYVQSGLKELLDYNLGENLCAMVYDQPIMPELMNEAGLNETIGCFNAGVILIDLIAWR